VPRPSERRVIGAKPDSLLNSTPALPADARYKLEKIRLLFFIKVYSKKKIKTLIFFIITYPQFVPRERRIQKGEDTIIIFIKVYSKKKIKTLITYSQFVPRIRRKRERRIQKGDVISF